MKAQINENIRKTKPWLTYAIREAKSVILSKKFEGAKCMSDFIKYLGAKKGNQFRHYSYILG